MDSRRKRLRVGLLGVALIAGCVASREKLQQLAPDAAALRDPGPWSVKYHHHIYRYRAEFGPFMTTELGPMSYAENTLKNKVVQTAHFSSAAMQNWHELVTADGDRVRLDVGAPPTEKVKLGLLELPGLPQFDRICQVSRDGQPIAEIRFDYFRNASAPMELGTIVSAEKTILIKVDKPVRKEMIDHLFNNDLRIGFYDGEERIGYLDIRPDTRVWIAQNLPADMKVLVGAACSVGLEIQQLIETQDKQTTAHNLQITSSTMRLVR